MESDAQVHLGSWFELDHAIDVEQVGEGTEVDRAVELVVGRQNIEKGAVICLFGSSTRSLGDSQANGR